MSKKTRCYKIVCQPLDTVLLVRKLSLPQEKKFYTVVRSKISNAETPINIDSYMDYLCQELVTDFSVVLDHFDEEDRSDAVNAVYTAVCTLYPGFRLEAVCDELNQTLFMEGVGEFFDEVAHEHHKWQISKSRSSKAINVKSLEDVNELTKFLSKNLIGQEQAVSAVADTMKLLAAGMHSFGSFFFVGPTGVGKTQLGRLLGEKFSGNFYKINCAEYSGGHEYSKLIGSPPGYVGHTEKTLLGEKAEESNRWVFLFDEIEKANPKFHDFLLSLLDDGTVTDNMGNELDFTESIFIFTSNQGVTDTKVGETTLGFGSHKVSYSEVQEDILESIKKKFNPEFLNRIDNFIFFKALHPDSVKEIVKLELGGLPIKKTSSLVSYIVKNAYSEEYGARNVRRFIKNKVAVKIADAILNNKVPKSKGDMYTPRVVKGELQIIDLKKYKKEKTHGVHDEKESA